MSIATRTGLWTLAALVLVVGVPLGFVASETSPSRALDILLGHHDGQGVWGLALEIIGYLLVPALVGAVVALLVERHIDVARTRGKMKAAVDDIKADLGLGPKPTK